MQIIFRISKKRFYDWNKNSLGKQIKKYRIAKDLSQEQLAEKIGIAVNNYGKIERGQKIL